MSNLVQVSQVASDHFPSRANLQMTANLLSIVALCIFIGGHTLKQPLLFSAGMFVFLIGEIMRATYSHPYLRLIIIIGIVCNFLATVTNAGRMPVFNYGSPVHDIAHTAGDSTTRMYWLSDIIGSSGWRISVGDIFLVTGLVLLTFMITCVDKRPPSAAQLSSQPVPTDGAAR